MEDSIIALKFRVGSMTIDPFGMTGYIESATIFVGYINYHLVYKPEIGSPWPSKDWSEQELLRANA